MKKLLSVIITLIMVFNTNAQQIVLEESAFYTQIEAAVTKAVKNLDNYCDPYGFSLTIKTAKTNTDGKAIALYSLDYTKVTEIIQRVVIKPQRFDKFNLETKIRDASVSGMLYYVVGLSPESAPQIGYEIYSSNFTMKVGSTSNAFQRIDVFVGANFVTKTPKNGSISGIVNYVEKDGSIALWNNELFPTSPDKAKGHIRYRRLGPGDKRTNSGDKTPVDEKEFFDIGFSKHENFVVTDRTPGHYYPQVRLRGCTQKFEDTSKDKTTEAIVKLTSRTNWENYRTADAEKIIGKVINTQYSLNNRVFGKVYDIQGKPLKGKKVVKLEPKEWAFSDREPEFNYLECKTNDEIYDFGNQVPSGVYYVYVEGSKDLKKEVEVCNCREKGERANHEYEVDIVGKNELYITIETDFSSKKEFESLVAGSFGPSGEGLEEIIAKTKQVYRISMMEVIGPDSSKSYVKEVGGVVLPSHDKVTGYTYNVPQLTPEGWKAPEDDNKPAENQVPDKSHPEIWEKSPKDGVPYVLSDLFIIAPLFEKPYEKKKNSTEGMNAEADKLMKSLNSIADDMAKMDLKGEMDGKYIVKTEAKPIPLSDLIAAAKNSKTILLEDKTVQQIEGSKTSLSTATNDETRMTKELQKNSPLGSAFEKHLGLVAAIGQGGITNYSMSGGEGRACKTTIERKMTIRAATPAEIKEAAMMPTEEIVEQLMQFAKKVTIIY